MSSNCDESYEDVEDKIWQRDEDEEQWKSSMNVPIHDGTEITLLGAIWLILKWMQKYKVSFKFFTQLLIDVARRRPMPI